MERPSDRAVLEIARVSRRLARRARAGVLRPSRRGRRRKRARGRHLARDAATRGPRGGSGLGRRRRGGLESVRGGRTRGAQAGGDPARGRHRGGGRRGGGRGDDVEGGGGGDSGRGRPVGGVRGRRRRRSERARKCLRAIHFVSFRLPSRCSRRRLRVFSNSSAFVCPYVHSRKCSSSSSSSLSLTLRLPPSTSSRHRVDNNRRPSLAYGTLSIHADPICTIGHPRGHESAPEGPYSTKRSRGDV